MHETLWVVMRPGRRRGVEVLYYLDRGVAEAKLAELNASLLPGVDEEPFYLEERVIGHVLVEGRPTRFSSEPRRRSKNRSQEDEEVD